MSLNQTQMKIASTAVIVGVIIASMACVIVYDETRDNSDGSTSVYNLLARVNTGGSGIYLNDNAYDGTTSTGIPIRNSAQFYKVDTTSSIPSYYVDETCKAAWGGLVCGTPGNTTIQHVQMKQLVESMGLKFALYESGASLADDTVYYINTVTSYDKVINSVKNNGISLDVGILWEPQFSNVIDVPSTEPKESFIELGLSNDFFHDHTCCVIAGYTSYVSSHQDVTERFLAGYMESVKWVQEAKNPSSENYAKLVQVCVDATKLDQNVIRDALMNINYVFGDDDGTGAYDLHHLKTDIADVVTANSSSLRFSMDDLGFANTIQFANRFVDDSYLIHAQSYDTSKVPAKTTSITVSAISGDIHQIALTIGKELGIFAQYGIDVNISYQTNGAGVAVAMQNGAAQFGFLGAPPATITAVNSKLITV